MCNSVRKKRIIFDTKIYEKPAFLLDKCKIVEIGRIKAYLDYKNCEVKIYFFFWHNLNRK